MEQDPGIPETPQMKSERIPRTQSSPELAHVDRRVPEVLPLGTACGFRFSVLQSTILVLAFVLFVFAFAVLVAHCLAWFIVYKTESRLGEVRKGLLRGGDMRMCLCARG